MIKRCHTCIYSVDRNHNCSIFPNDMDHDKSVEECLGEFNWVNGSYNGYKLWQPRIKDIFLTKEDMTI